ncbi:MAG: hypothetical protein JWP94_9 [Mucilaginibacter sp.]|nr:hypothetical protein [Mucilaginibacter sp.]
MRKIVIPLIIILACCSFCKKATGNKQGTQQVILSNAPDSGNPNPGDAGLTAAFAAITADRIATLTAGIRASGYHVESALPPGYVKDGSVDYTTQVQAALKQANVNIIFPPFPIQINDGGLTFQSNQQILFEDGAELRLKASALQSYKMLNVLGVDKLIMINAVIKGDRDIHTGPDGESGMGINIKNCTNVMLIKPKVTNCWGDGIYMSGSNTNTIISDAQLSRNRRNNMSVISANGLYLIRPYFGFAVGTAPEVGIDFEPNAAADDLLNIHVVSPVTEGNGGEGISLGLKRIYQDPGNYPLWNMSVTVYNHHDINSGLSIKLSYAKCGYTTETTVKGFVKFISPIWENKSGQFISAAICEPATITSVVDPQLSVNGVALSSATAKSTLLSEVSSGTLNVTVK